MSCIPSNPDVSGIGVRIAIYAQTFLSFAPAWWALSDGEVSEVGLDALEKQSTTILLTAFALLITAMEQSGRRQISNFHGNIVLSLSWMNNTNTFIYFLLYVQYQSQEGLKSSWSAWWEHIRNKLALRKGASQFSAPQDVNPSQTGQSVLTQWPLALRTLFKRIVLVLGSLHLSMMASLGIWLWSHPASFGMADSCAIQQATSPILGKDVPLGSRGLHVSSIVIYTLFLPPGLNLILPMVLFLGLFIIYQKWHQRLASDRLLSNPSPGICTMDRHLPYFYKMFHHLPSSPSIVPIVIGLLLLLGINLIFTIDIELTLRRNRRLQESGETDWTFGQVLAMLLLVLPLRDILESILAREEKRRRGEHTVSLRNAIKEGAAAGTILDLMTKGADVNVKVQDSKWVTALQLASSRGDEDLVTTLLEKRAEIDVQGGEDHTVLHAALREPNQKILKSLLQAGANPDILGDQYGTALQCASSRGYLDAVELLLIRAADPNVQGGAYGTALHAAAHSGHLAILELLLDKHADPNILTGNLGTVLQVASSEGRLDMVELLLQANADPNIKGGEYETALQAASYRKHREIVRLLLEHGADPDIQGGTYGTALQAAALKSAASVPPSLPILELLLEHGANPNINAGEYGTALHAAAAEGQLEMFKLLLAKKANPNIRGGRFGTALQAAAASEEPAGLEIVRLLLDMPSAVDPNVQGGEYKTALHAAATFGNEDVVELLLKRGADRSIRGDNNKTALDVAQDGGYRGVEAILRAPKVNGSGEH